MLRTCSSCGCSFSDFWDLFLYRFLGGCDVEYAAHTGHGNLVFGHGHSMLFVSLPVSLSLSVALNPKPCFGSNMWGSQPCRAAHGCGGFGNLLGITTKTLSRKPICQQGLRAHRAYSQVFPVHERRQTLGGNSKGPSP